MTRAQIQAGETVLINGATGSAGQLAVQIARYLGAKRIIATGRNAQTLAALDADECIQLTADDKTLSGQFSATSAAQIDVVIDYLWGHSAEVLLPALAKYTPAGRPVRYVQVGSLAGADIALNGAVLRSAPLVLMGSGIGSLSMPQLLAATGEMLQAAVPGKVHHRHHPAAAAGDRGGLAAGRQSEAYGFHPRIKNRFRTKMGLIS